MLSHHVTPASNRPPPFASGPHDRTEAAVYGLPSSSSENNGRVVDMLRGGSGGNGSEPDAGEKATASEVVPHDDGHSAADEEEDIWPYMTTREKRRLWLKRRQMGEFFFRSEFKGLVHAVRSFFCISVHYYLGRASVR